ncbi:MAG: zinc metallopeptidase [Myxococcota bacterium]
MWFGMGCLIVLCCLPAVLSTVGLLWHRFGPQPKRSPLRDEAAGAWLERQIEGAALDVGVEVHGAPGLDAYWPSVDAIGLSAPTWHGRRATELAIAAHELGHALNIRSHWLAAHALPIARLAQGLSWRAFAATVFSALLVGAGGLIPFATVLLGVSLVVTLTVCGDEWFASWRAVRFLRDDPTVSDDEIKIAQHSMRSAGTVYALDLVGQLFVLASWPFVIADWPSLSGPTSIPSPEAVGLAVVMVPVLLLRAAHVGLQVWDPEPVTTDFRLFTVMSQESRWEFLTGLAVLTVVVMLHPLLTGPFATSALVGATMTAIGPVGALLRAIVLVPLVLLLHRFAEPDPEEQRLLFKTPNLETTAPALLALYTNPPWYLRVSWLANLAYIPLLAVAAVRLCTWA